MFHVPTPLRAPLALMFVVFMSLLMIFGLGITRAMDRATAASDRAVANSDRIAAVTYADCVTRNDAAGATNTVLDQLIVGAEESKAFSVSEKQQRVALWHAVRQQVIACTKPTP